MVYSRFAPLATFTTSFSRHKHPAYKNEKAYAEAVVSLFIVHLQRLGDTLQASVIQSAADLMPQFKFVLGKENKDTKLTITTVTDAFVYKSDVDTQSRPTQWNKAEL